MAIKTVTVNGVTHDINDARITDPSSSSTSVYLRGDYTWQTVSGGSSTDTKVSQTIGSTVGAYPILLSPQAGRADWSDGTREAQVNPFVTVNPSNSRVFVSPITTTSPGFGLYDSENNKTDGLFELNTVGTASIPGIGRLTLGNNTASGTVGNAHGEIWLYGDGTNRARIMPSTDFDSGTTDYTFYLPYGLGDHEFVMTGGAQTIAGNKTFSGNVYFANGTSYYVSSAGTANLNGLTVSNRLIGKYTTTLNTTTSVQANNIFSGTPTVAGIDNQIAFVVVE